MEYRYLGRSGFRVPALSLGTATFGGKGDFFAAWGDTGLCSTTEMLLTVLSGACRRATGAGRLAAREPCLR
jgi:aryl-alcohol dehydrogenase-like predicted oxidoreductase